jgi:hypothetical protein
LRELPSNGRIAHENLEIYAACLSTLVPLCALAA